MKNIVQRNLSLNTKYFLIDKKYIPVLNGGGQTCANCGQLIANIATVKNENNQCFNIGFDCLETLLINNQLLSKSDIESYFKIKQMIPKILRFSKHIKEVINSNKNITGLYFETPDFENYFTFYWLQNNETRSRNNDFVKLKDVSFPFLIETLKNIFPKLQILSDEKS